jgi:hypothetical protein
MYKNFMPQDKIQVFLYKKGAIKYQKHKKTISSEITVTLLINPPIYPIQKCKCFIEKHYPFG